MLVIESRCDKAAHQEQLSLPFELRQKSRLRTKLSSGEEAGLFLEHGSILRGGDCLVWLGAKEHAVSGHRSVRLQDGQVRRPIRDRPVPPTALSAILPGCCGPPRCGWGAARSFIPMQVECSP